MWLCYNASGSGCKCTRATKRTEQKFCWQNCAPSTSWVLTYTDHRHISSSLHAVLYCMSLLYRRLTHTTNNTQVVKDRGSKFYLVSTTDAVAFYLVEISASPPGSHPTIPDCSSGMATASGVVLKFVPLSKEEQDAVAECMRSLDAAPLQEHSDSEVDLNGLDGVVQTFVQKFAPWTKVCSSSLLFSILM